MTKPESQRSPQIRHTGAFGALIERSLAPIGIASSHQARYLKTDRTSFVTSLESGGPGQSASPPCRALFVPCQVEGPKLARYAVAALVTHTNPASFTVIIIQGPYLRSTSGSAGVSSFKRERERERERERLSSTRSRSSHHCAADERSSIRSVRLAFDAARWLARLASNADA